MRAGSAVERLDGVRPLRDAGVPSIAFSGEADESISLLTPGYAETGIDVETFLGR